jgi:fructose-1,6-bisphosphatase/inositol monophosphatase family enzyme
MTSALLDLAMTTAHAAAELLLAGRVRALATVETKSTSTDMVSELDRASEDLIRDRLLTARPHDGFLGEEGGAQEGTSGLRWVVDPLDGTTNYLYDHPGWNVSIAAEDEHGPVVGVVVNPALNETFTATRGGGAHRNGSAIHASAAADLATALCATGFAYDPARRARQGEVLTAVLPRVRDVRRMGAAATDLCSVACGRVDAYWERGLGPWDLAGGSLIAMEAGARVNRQSVDGFVLAATPGVFDALRALLSASGAAGA